MSYSYIVKADFPRAYWTFNTLVSGIYSDQMGNAYDANVTGSTPIFEVPLVADNGKSINIGNGSTIDFETAGYFSPTNESQSFSLEMWVRLLSTDAINLLSHSGEDDGIIFTGTHIRFVTKYDDTSEFYIEKEVEIDKSYHIVATHTYGQNSLYINGELAGNVIVIPSSGAIYDAPTTPTHLISGENAGSNSAVLIDSVSIYDYVISTKKIIQHYSAGINVRTVADIIHSCGGYLWRFSDNEASSDLSLIFNDYTSFSTGLIDGVSLNDNGLFPVFDESNLTVDGSWTIGMILHDTITTPIAGSKIEWTSIGSIIVESSIDNETTWQTCTSGETIPGLTSGVDTTDKSLSIKVSFPSGEVETTETQVNSIYVVIYSSKILKATLSSRTASIIDPIYLTNTLSEPIEYSSGAIVDGGYVIISEDTEVDIPTSIGTIEMWIEPRTINSSNYLIDFRTIADTALPYLWYNSSTPALLAQGISNVYVNGQSITLSPYEIKPKSRYHLVIVLTTQINEPVTLFSKYTISDFSNLRINVVSIYEEQLNSSDILQLYNDYIGGNSIQISDTSTISFNEHSPATLLYTHDWAITGAGG